MYLAKTAWQLSVLFRQRSLVLSLIPRLSLREEVGRSCKTSWQELKLKLKKKKRERIKAGVFVGPQAS